MGMFEQDRSYYLRSVSAKLNWSERTLRRAIDCGEIKAFRRRAGAPLQVRGEELNRYISTLEDEEVNR